MRKTLTVTIDDENRDKGKIFVVTEMDAWHAEKWAGRLLFAAMNAGVEIPDGISQAGMAGLATLGIQALTRIPFEAAEPLLDEMMDCVQIQPSPSVTRALIGDDIEEVSTLIRLRRETLKLHIEPFMKGVQSTSGPGDAKTQGSSNTPTSQKQ